MKRINRDGPRVLGGLPAPERRPGSELPGLLGAGVMVVDARPAREYAAAHVPGTITIPLNKSFTTWAGWLVPYDEDFYLIAADDEAARRAARSLAMIGLDRMAGWFPAAAIEAWSEAAGRPAAALPAIDVGVFRGRLDAEPSLEVLDVRGAGEWQAGHLPLDSGQGGRLHHIPLGYLEDRLAELPRDTPLVVHCASGARSATAVSLLEKHGFGNAVNLEGGFSAWEEAGLPVAWE
jgi:hydroxyacylglutathione hydrolase